MARKELSALNVHDPAPEEAVVDTETGIVTGSRGVQGSGPLGTVNASSYAIYEQGERVVFSGSGDNKVRGTMNAAGSDR